MNSISTRQQMVKQQVRVWDVFDQAVLNVLGNVARERFVPAGCEDVQYCLVGNIPATAARRNNSP